MCNLGKVTKKGCKSVRLRGRTRPRIAVEWAFYAHSLAIGRGSATVPPSVATLPISSPQDSRRLASSSHAHSLFALLMRINHHIIGVGVESDPRLSGHGRIPQAHYPLGSLVLDPLIVKPRGVCYVSKWMKLSLARQSQTRKKGYRRRIAAPATSPSSSSRRDRARGAGSTRSSTGSGPSSSKGSFSWL